MNTVTIPSEIDGTIEQTMFDCQRLEVFMRTTITPDDKSENFELMRGGSHRGYRIDLKSSVTRCRQQI